MKNILMGILFKKDVKEFKTLQKPSSDLLDVEINFHLNKGWEILPNSYKVVNEDTSSKKELLVYTQVVVWKDYNGFVTEFYEDGQPKTRGRYINDEKGIVSFLVETKGKLLADLGC